MKDGIKTVRIARFSEIEIVASRSAFILVLFFIVWFTCNLFFKYYQDPVAKTFYPFVNFPMLGIAMTIVIFAAVVGHEISHVLVARRFNVYLTTIGFTLLGGFAVSEDESAPFPSPKAEFLTTLVGPVSSLLLAGIFWLLAFKLMPPLYPAILQDAMTVISPASVVMLLNYSLTSDFLIYLFFLILLLGVLNLVPAIPLDGGWMLRSILWRKSKNLAKATKISFFIAIPLLIIIPIVAVKYLGYYGLVALIIPLRLIPMAREEYRIRTGQSEPK